MRTLAIKINEIRINYVIHFVVIIILYLLRCKSRCGESLLYLMSIVLAYSTRIAGE